ncbi:MAG: 16S rRNA (cytidine(1402)-2'-O)-methyltransferase [Oscillatoriales cyanobacterium]|uniref:Ribosomal RNA small subunit methyltransferase I n=1 Tax=Microcoleus anatoxicus PTRS2 TaxID=2705321 RepID=A0ABU8YGI9_9CYAN|nr:MAG: 16S rRNA (cytidine(1402)-2'-O)-methyltransferase [Oscillatoriales cyanobacterium]TAD97512.1 MAG: 16S rRNA (cytidine(1402)-2'-O)-methyltransferase [Oscillatoriales cyanobacterium]TAE06268.1 MAG: 16S rRNA (cytidine(1402)-2'-O)-methyltransferase [Oscillatoriales cyanobacterium]TAF04190.1 MAG: 16S rRNA (cytidine(1402)-2'-O)-methyltransferase [Oscillatoriales cyanobacterium]TAF40686.1 MAG: 16S rRNA (cytidine(1402)-2'-O)-methyltransferase [Oscillatoriales cyanobacterium]
MQVNPHTGTLYIVGTPIGNLEDMTFRAIKILQAADFIAAEDTRHTGKLLQHFQIKTPQISYHEHNRHQRLPELIDKLLLGKDIALVTDAGMPGISDPGSELVKACADANINIIPIPGACACIVGISASGLPTDRFVFEGFLPAKGQERQQSLEALQIESRTIILYESPHRLRQTLQDLANVLGSDRQIVLARELTKMHEEFWRGSVESAIELYTNNEPKGEFTLIIGGTQTATPVFSEDAIKAELQTLISEGISRSQASRQLAQQTSLPRRQIYQLALTLDDNQSPE